MAPLALEQIAEEISEEKTRGYRHRKVAFHECRSKAILTSIATGFMGFSAGFAVQVGGRNFWPGVIQKYHVIPLLVSMVAPVWTFNRLVTDCENQHKMKQKYVQRSEDDSREDVMLS